ncbi:MAG: hypothetical protein AB7U99_07605 [Steroidobacteraceae bacterium]
MSRFSAINAGLEKLVCSLVKTPSNGGDYPADSSTKTALKWTQNRSKSIALEGVAKPQKPHLNVQTGSLTLIHIAILISLKFQARHERSLAA